MSIGSNEWFIRSVCSTAYLRMLVHVLTLVILVFLRLWMSQLWKKKSIHLTDFATQRILSHANWKKPTLVQENKVSELFTKFISASSQAEQRVGSVPPWSRSCFHNLWKYNYTKWPCPHFAQPQQESTHHWNVQSVISQSPKRFDHDCSFNSYNAAYINYHALTSKRQST